MRKPKTPRLTDWKATPLIDEGEIFGELAEKKGSSLFLGRYSMNEVIAVLGRKGLLREARKRYLWPLKFSLNSSEYPLQRFQIFFGEEKPENLIVDLKIRETSFTSEDPLPGLPVLPPQKCLVFEWLTLQNPLLEFSVAHSPLPGQTRPGLRMSRAILDLFVYMGRVTRKDCLIAFPAYFHNALLFSRYFRFWNPYKEGEVLAIRRRFRRMSLNQLAWIVHLNCLRKPDGTVYEWISEEQIHPLTDDIKAYFDAKAYRDIVKGCLRNLDFSVDDVAFVEKKGEIS